MAYIRCSEETHRRLKMESAKRGMSMQALVEGFVEEILNRADASGATKSPPSSHTQRGLGKIERLLAYAEEILCAGHHTATPALESNLAAFIELVRGAGPNGGEVVKDDPAPGEPGSLTEQIERLTQSERTARPGRKKAS